MLKDILNNLAESQDLDGEQSIESEHVIDTAEDNRDLAVGRPLWFEVIVEEDFASAQGDNTLTVEVQASDSEGSGYETILAGPEVDKDDLKEGVKILIPYPYQGKDLKAPKRYIRLNFEQGGTASDWTAGIVSANLVGG